MEPHAFNKAAALTLQIMCLTAVLNSLKLPGYLSVSNADHHNAPWNSVQEATARTKWQTHKNSTNTRLVITGSCLWPSWGKYQQFMRNNNNHIPNPIRVNKSWWLLTILDFSPAASNQFLCPCASSCCFCLKQMGAFTSIEVIDTEPPPLAAHAVCLRRPSLLQ